MVGKALLARSILFCSWIVAIAASAADLPSTLEKIRPGIVAVGTVQPTRSPRSLFLGTGFVVGNGRYIVTNRHVVPRVLDFERKEQLAIFTGRGKQANVRVADLVAQDETHDLAVLEISGAPLPALKLGDAAGVREGERFAFTGFPIGMVLGLYPVTHRGIVSAITPIAIPNVSSRQLTAAQIRRLRNPYTVFQLDAIAYPGNSGSPLYDPADGSVVGVVNSVFVKGTKEEALENPSGIAYAIPISHLQKLLKKSNITYR